ncbi:MAG: class I SAM-dependent methyltransferase [Pseudomonadota bacterium]
MPETFQPNLDGVPETLLWPLWHRAAEQKRANPVVDDPLAAKLVSEIDYDFRGKFGPPNAMHPVRAALCDQLVREYLDTDDPNPTVIALGDGLETQQWRVSDDRVRWISVDLPEAIECRRRLLPKHPQAELIACSALDPAWLDAVPRDSKPFISAAGLLMYFEERDTINLLTTIADVFRDAHVFFDTIPPAFSNRTRRGFHVTPTYRAPPMPWGLSIDDASEFVTTISGLQYRQSWTYGDAIPARTPVLAALSKIGWIRRRLAPGMVYARTTARAFAH